MDIQQNMANVLRALKTCSGKSVTEFSEELEISRSALQEYLSGTGNPNAITIDHLATMLDISPSFLVSGCFSADQIEILMQLLDVLKLLAGLNMSDRRRFAELLLDMVELWGDNHNAQS